MSTKGQQKTLLQMCMQSAVKILKNNAGICFAQVEMWLLKQILEEQLKPSMPFDLTHQNNNISQR